MPAKDPKDMNLEELEVFTASLKAQVEHKDDEHKQAMDEEEKKAKQAMEDEKKNHDAQDEKKEEDHKEALKALKASLLSAMEEKDEEKKDAAMKAILQAMDDEKKNHEAHKAQDDPKEDEEKKALKAQVTYLTASVNKPKIAFLNKVYKAAKTEEATLTGWNKEWEGMNSKQLDGAIAKTKPLVETLEYKGAEQEEKSPFGFSTADGPGTKEFSADKKFKSIDDLSDEELFGGGMYA